MSIAEIISVFDEPTFTATHIVIDPQSRDCAVIDSVLGYDAASGRTNKQPTDDIITIIRDRDLRLQWVLETHIHADHLSGAPYIHEKLGGKLAIGAEIVTVQNIFGKIFNAGTEFQCDGSQFDQLFVDGDQFHVGTIPAYVLHTPGHTPACMTYVIGDAAFVGDALFMPDFGTGRADFPGGNARHLYRSIRKILALPPETRLFLCHDYKVPGRDEFCWVTTVAEERANNVHAHDGVTEDAFVEMRNARDATLNMPKLILPSVQVNMRAGRMPPAEDNGQCYLKIPVDML